MARAFPEHPFSTRSPMSATLSFTAPTAHGPRDITLAYARVGAGEPLLLLAKA
ncbi:alpha/beta hydrolase, partial [Streptomyces violaceoruber]